MGRLGPAIETHSRFPEGANVGFLQVFDGDRVALRVWERGVGETQACGSGACATVILGIQLGLLQEEVEVIFKKGSLFVKYNEESRKLTARGTANFLKEINVSL